MDLDSNNRTEIIKARVSQLEKDLVQAKAECYGYRKLSSYLRDAAIYEKVTYVDLKGKNEICKAYSDNTQLLKKIYKEVKHICQFATQIDEYKLDELLFKMYEVLKKQKDMLKLIENKLDLDVWQKINHSKIVKGKK